MRLVTLVYCIRDDSVLLGMKKRGFGQGKLNGYGGKVHDGEDITDAAARELSEEAGISCDKSDLEKVAEIDFFFPEVPKEKGWDQTVHVYVLRKWTGTPKETDEMKPEWHKISATSYEKMWVGDPYWLPLVLGGKKIRAAFTFGGQGDSVAEYHITESSF